MILVICICVCLCVVCALRCRCLERSEVSDPLELELQVVVNHAVWVLGTKLGSFARAVSALNF